MCMLFLYIHADDDLMGKGGYSSELHGSYELAHEHFNSFAALPFKCVQVHYV